jgi:hypothetical protein
VVVHDDLMLRMRVRLRVSTFLLFVVLLAPYCMVYNKHKAMLLILAVDT